MAEAIAAGLHTQQLYGYAKGYADAIDHVRALDDPTDRDLLRLKKTVLEAVIAEHEGGSEEPE